MVVLGDTKMHCVAWPSNSNWPIFTCIQLRFPKVRQLINSLTLLWLREYYCYSITSAQHHQSEVINIKFNIEHNLPYILFYLWIKNELMYCIYLNVCFPTLFIQRIGTTKTFIYWLQIRIFKSALTVNRKMNETRSVWTMTRYSGRCSRN